MARRIAAALGVDLVQWRVLVTAYLRMDFRSTAGATPARGAGKRASVPLLGMAFVMGITGFAFAMIGSAMPDPMLAATLLTTYGAISTAMLLLVDFTGVVISPTDYGVLGHRPVSSRTYFAARLTSVLVYISAISLSLALLPAGAFALRRGFGVSGFVAGILSVLLCNASATVLVIFLYAKLASVVHPRRLRRAMTYLQLASAMTFYGAYYLMTTGFQGTALTGVRFDEMRWLWLNPASWFAALVPLAGGVGTRHEWIAATAAVVVAAACVPVAAGRLSLEYAATIGELTASAEPVRRRRPWRWLSVPGFRRDEARAVALLVGAQFRYDQKFRLAILGLLPLMAFYLLLGLRQGALIDPISDPERSGGAFTYMAVIFIPMTLHASLEYSDSFRAAWIFFATPASAARLVVAAKNFATVFFLGGYLLVLAAIWSFTYERVWHAVLHAFVVGLLAHVLLQLAVILRPGLPFSMQPRQGEHTGRMFVLFLVGGIAAAVISEFIPIIYTHASWTAVFVGAVLAVTAVIEYALRQRVTEAVGELEYVG
ncbi:MAG: hypothetical protein DMF86_11660 [Acidobacteria bacterium]|nr:MAG: hypothetical protein DMF86_11660 [Acidobacteriota bacterium]